MHDYHTKSTGHLQVSHCGISRTVLLSMCWKYLNCPLHRLIDYFQCRTATMLY